MSEIETPVFYATAYRQLQPVERHFVDSYVRKLDNDAARANERISHALHRPPTMDAVRASQGMLERPMVQAAIVERIKELAEKQELTVRKLVREYSNLAFSNMNDYGDIGEDGSFTLNLTKATPEQMAAVQSIDIEEYEGKGGTFSRKTKIRLHAKQPSLDALAKYTGMLEADNPYYRAETAKPVNATALPHDASAAMAADIYSSVAHGNG